MGANWISTEYCWIVSGTPSCHNSLNCDIYNKWQSQLCHGSLIKSCPSSLESSPYSKEGRHKKEIGYKNPPVFL